MKGMSYYEGSIYKYDEKKNKKNFSFYSSFRDCHVQTSEKKGVFDANNVVIFMYIFLKKSKLQHSNTHLS